MTTPIRMNGPASASTLVSRGAFGGSNALMVELKDGIL